MSIFGTKTRRGLISGGLIIGCIFCLQVDGPINAGGVVMTGGRLISLRVISGERAFSQFLDLAS